MKKSIVLFCFLLSFGFILKSNKKPNQNGVVIPIEWYNNLRGDFSFASKWSFAENIGLNSAQQIACVKNCSERVKKMMDDEGLILSDSTDIYYQIIDSTRKYHSLESRCTLYDWKQSNFIKVRRYGNFVLEGSVIQDSSSRCNLFFRIKDDYLTAWAYHKPDKGSTKIFHLNGGKIFLDKEAFDKGIFKATFSFTFENDLNNLKALFWSGKIYTKIEGF